MRGIEFAEFVSQLCLYFDRKPPATETMTAWFDECRDIPSRSLSWIGKSFKNYYDSWPRNFGKAFLQQWSTYLDAHPNEVDRESDNLGCKGCYAGYIEASEYVESMGTWYNTKFRCDHCRPKWPKAMAITNVDYLYRQGYHKPLGYLTAFKYADILPDIPDVTPVINAMPHKPVADIVADVAEDRKSTRLNSVT